MHAGPEIRSRCDQKLYIADRNSNLLALLLGRIRHLSSAQGIEVFRRSRVCRIWRAGTDQTENIEKVAEKYADAAGFLFLGAGSIPPIALEGSEVKGDHV